VWQARKEKGTGTHFFSLSLLLSHARITFTVSFIAGHSERERKKRKVEFLSRRNTQAGTVMKFTA
jgi:hypothetical protein